MFKFHLSAKKLKDVKTESFRRDAQIKVMGALRANVPLDNIQVFIAQLVTAKLVDDNCSDADAFEFYAKHRSVIDPIVTDITAEPFRCFCDPSYLLKKLGFNAPAVADAPEESNTQKEPEKRVIGSFTLSDVTQETHLFPVGLSVATDEEIKAAKEKQRKTEAAGPVTADGDNDTEKLCRKSNSCTSEETSCASSTSPHHPEQEK
jgi:hypothetical protein